MRFTLVLAIVFMSSSVAFAQSAADIATARDLFREGMDLRAQGHLADALVKLKAAHDLYETPPSALELARTQIDLGRLAEGCETLLSIERIPSAKDSERSKQARLDAKDLESRTKARIPTLRIDVKGNASVTLDGALVSQALFGIARKIDPGKHVVGCGSKRIDVDVPEGQAISIPCESDVQILGALSDGSGNVIASQPRADRFSVLYKFLPPKADERWTLHARGGALTCALPCEHWIGEHSGAYLMRAPTADDEEARRVDVSDMLPATIGSTVTARPHAGKGSPAAGFAGAWLSVLGVLGVLGGVPTLIVGVVGLGDDTGNSHRDITIAGGIISGVSTIFLVLGLVLTGNNYPSRIDYVVGP
jgi:hypothetical protein